ncbi:MAG: 6-pyruvoyl trahydropterin synthase family protein [Bacteroidota bacterium]
MVYVTRRSTFSASHRLYNPDFSEEKNREIFDKCANAMGHGHNYVVEVTVAGDPQKETGYVIDLSKLKQIIKKEILDKVDHKHLNHDVGFLQGIIPTAENLAKAFWEILASKVPAGKLVSVRLRETENNVVEYRGES